LILLKPNHAFTLTRGYSYHGGVEIDTLVVNF
jgi:hypothetical protein